MFERRLIDLQLSLPPEPWVPEGVDIPFDWVRVVGERCVLSGHGALDRVREWGCLSGFVNADVGYDHTTAVLNPASDLVLEIFGEHGRHTRTAIGVAALPLNLPVVIAAELLVYPAS